MNPNGIVKRMLAQIWENHDPSGAHPFRTNVTHMQLTTCNFKMKHSCRVACVGAWEKHTGDIDVNT